MTPIAKPPPGRDDKEGVASGAGKYGLKAVVVVEAVVVLLLREKTGCKEAGVVIPSAARRRRLGAGDLRVQGSTEEGSS